MSKIKVLVVDDSSLMRKMISNMVNRDSALEVVDTAVNGYFALEKINKYHPDVILLDIEMPQMDGIQFLYKCREQGIDIPVIVVSSLGRSKPQITMQALDLGAKDFIIKPSGTISLDIETLQDEIIAKIKYFHEEHITGAPVKKQTVKPYKKEPISPAKTYEKPETFVRAKIEPTIPPDLDSIEDKIRRISRIDLVAIGISTGGPAALRKILPILPKEFTIPILIVQHMPPGFTREFANSLNEICVQKVKEAEDKDPVNPSTIYIAPGDKHMLVSRVSGSYEIKLSESSPTLGHKPSVEELFLSINRLAGDRVLAAIMTGMGKDGANAIKKIRESGGITIGQDSKSCVVYGMPKVAYELGGIDLVCTLNDIPDQIIEIAGRINK